MSDEKQKHGRGMTLRERVRLVPYWLVHVDPEVMAGSPEIDRFHMQAKAVLLLAVAGIALFSWNSFLLLFFPWFIALPLLCPIMVWIVMIDALIGASHWKSDGILRVPKARQSVFSWALLLRLGIAIVTSSATALSATLAISHATIEAQEQKDRNEANAALRANGEAEKQQLWHGMLGADDAAVKEAAAGLKTLQQQIADAHKNRESAAGVVTDAQVNADCQLHGDRASGCRRGKGHKYYSALIRSKEANAAMGRAAADLAALEAQQPNAENKYQDALKAFRAREGDYLTAAQAIDARVARDAVPARNDPVMAYRALQKIYQSPDGKATRFYSHLMMALLLTVELSFVLVSEYFGHASIYMTRLMARTRYLAAEVAAEYRRKIAALFDGGDNTDPPGAPVMSYRMLPRFGADD